MKYFLNTIKFKIMSILLFLFLLFLTIIICLADKFYILAFIVMLIFDFIILISLYFCFTQKIEIDSNNKVLKIYLPLLMKKINFDEINVLEIEVNANNKILITIVFNNCMRKVVFGKYYNKKSQKLIKEMKNLLTMLNSIEIKGNPDYKLINENRCLYLKKKIKHNRIGMIVTIFIGVISAIVFLIFKIYGGTIGILIATVFSLFISKISIDEDQKELNGIIKF